MEKEIKVMLIEDESDFRQLMTFWLESKGYSVVGAPDGKQALQVLKDEKPDIIFLDLYMPVMDGLESLKRIRKMDREIPVILISAHVNDPRAKQATSYGISGVFSKSEEFTKGLSLLEAALRTHKKLKK